MDFSGMHLIQKTTATISLRHGRDQLYGLAIIDWHETDAARTYYDTYKDL